MTEEINLADFNIVTNDEGCVIVENNMVLLEDRYSKVIVSAEFSQVADYFNLSGRTEHQQEIIQTPPEPEPPAPEETNILSRSQDNVQGIESKHIKWGLGDTKLLLHLYAENIGNVGPLKRFRLKKNMWAFIANEIYKRLKMSYTSLQVETRYKCVIKRTKTNVENNNTSGAVRMDSEFDDELEQIMKLDDSICPDYLLSSTGMTRSKKSCISENEPTHQESELSSNDVASPSGAPAKDDDGMLRVPARRKRKTVQEKMFEQYMLRQDEKLRRQEEQKLLREENRERRHMERLQVLKDISQNEKRYTQ